MNTKTNKTEIKTIETGLNTYTIMRVEVIEVATGENLMASEPIHVLKNGEYLEAFGGQYPESKAQEFISSLLTVEEIANAFRAAKKAVKNVKDCGDQGTCNFDSPAIVVPPRKAKRYLSAAEEAGISLFEYGRRKYWVKDLGVGSRQGTQQTKEAEAASRAMLSHGLVASVYYAMD